MCLSTAYEVGGAEDKLLCDRVTSIEVDGGEVRLTDLLGRTTIVSGHIKNIDLNQNIIRIQAQQ